MLTVTLEMDECYITAAIQTDEWQDFILQSLVALAQPGFIHFLFVITIAISGCYITINGEWEKEISLICIRLSSSALFHIWLKWIFPEANEKKESFIIILHL